jgi:hypothetical protein
MLALAARLTREYLGGQPLSAEVIRSRISENPESKKVLGGGV